MISKGRRKGTVRFAVHPAEGARKVHLAGEFTGWQPRSMRRQKSGQFVASVELRPGRHEYKFLVDGQWMLDPDNSTAAANPYGSFNSVIDMP